MVYSGRVSFGSTRVGSVPPYAASEERSEEGEDGNQDKEEEKHLDSDMVIEAEDEDVSDREIDSQDSWETLREDVEDRVTEFNL